GFQTRVLPQATMDESDSLPDFGTFFLSLNSPTRLALVVSAAGPGRVSLVPDCCCGACHALRPRQTFQSLTDYSSVRVGCQHS
ncbi:MAG: hypothetical protein WCQ21_36655, partial [Verrucomicrobiota bacterium]